VSTPADAVVLLSGGLDSAVAGALARSRGLRLHALTLGYGQRHARELASARRQARLLGCASHQVLRLPLDKVATGALLTGPASRLRTRKGALPAAYVSFRNGVFLAFAFSMAEAMGAREVWGGWCETDQAGYPDCRPRFLRAMARAASLGTRQGSQGRGMAVRAPLTGWDKARIVRAGVRLGVDFSATWTCYAGAARPCGECDACRLRAQGFAQAGVADPLSMKEPCKGAKGR